MPRSPLSIRAKLILSISIPLLITYLGLLAWDYQHQRELAIADLKEFLQQRAEGAAGQIDSRLTSIAQLSRMLTTPLTARRNDEQITAAAAGAMRNPWVSSVTVTLNEGDKLATRFISKSDEDFRAADLKLSAAETPDWYEHAKTQSATGWTGARIAEPAGRRVTTYYTIVRNGEEIVGAIGLDVSIEALRRFGPQRNGPRIDQPRGPATQRAPGPNAGPPIDVPRGQRAGRAEGTRNFEDFLVFDAAGELLSAPAADEAKTANQSLYDDAKLLGQPVLADATNSALGGESQVVQLDNLGKAMPSVGTDATHWLALAPVHGSGWLVAVAMSESGRTAEAIDRLWQRAIFLSIGSLVMLAVVWIVAVRISRPIEQLARGVDDVAAGNLNAAVPDTGTRDELGRLARGFNHMTARIRQHVAEIRSQTTAHERVESELRVARQIQLDLLPKTFPPFPDRTEFELHALNLSALHVAGDFYDFFFLPDGKLTLVIADVSGKGVPAALLMAVTRTLVRNLALSGQSPAQIMTATNRALLVDTPQTMFVTMVLCQYDPFTGALTYVNAGHPAPLRLRAGQTPQPICDDYSCILGVDDSGALGEFVQHDVHLAPGDTLLLYTDGVSESPAPGRDILGTDGLTELLKSHGGDSPEELCMSLAQTIRSYQGPNLQDDVTLLALRRSK